MSGRKRKFNGPSFLGTVLFFLLIAVTVTCAMFVYAAIEDMAIWCVSVIMLVVVAGLSLLCTAVDLLRRKFMVDRPVRSILAATDAIAKGDFSVRIKPFHAPRRYDEFDEIIENLNRMAAELSKSEVLKTDFIANVSHEIKTPLSVIRSYTGLLARKNLKEEDRKNYCDAVIAAERKLTALVTDILKLNKLENQELALEFEKVELGEMVREAILSFEEQIEKKELEIEADIDDIAVFSYPQYLEIVWNNLLSNAVKFTPQGGSIHVTVKESFSGGAVVSVKDSGIGIAPETGAHIFEKFYQGDKSHAGEGNGLGLTLVKRVIDVLGGEISVESKLGQGSKFTVALRGVMGAEHA